MEIIGIDVGGTKTTFIGFEFKKGILRKEWEERIKTSHLSFSEWFSLISEKAKSKKIALSMPGFLENGVVKNSPNFKELEGKRIKRWLKKITPSFIVENDANCFAYAEAIVGKGKGKEGIIAGWIFGTGVGGGLVLKKKGMALLLSEKTEFGSFYVGVEEDLFLKHSKRAREIKRKYGFLTLEGVASGKVREELGKNFSKVKGLVEKAIINSFYNVQLTVSPSLHVIGGGFGKALGKEFFKRIEKQVKKKYKIGKPNFSIELFSIRDDAGVIGAVLLFLAKNNKKIKKVRLD